MTVTGIRSWAGDANVLLALQSISQQQDLVAFSALPDAPVLPARRHGRGRVRRPGRA